MNWKRIKSFFSWKDGIVHLRPYLDNIHTMTREEKDTAIKRLQTAKVNFWTGRICAALYSDVIELLERP